jgi:hypothetical protein
MRRLLGERVRTEEPDATIVPEDVPSRRSSRRRPPPSSSSSSWCGGGGPVSTVALISGELAKRELEWGNER